MQRAGNIKACIGLNKNGCYYVPVTSLKEDIRDLVTNQERIIAIFEKDICEALYSKLV
jgi:hypothetical protein